MLRTDIFIFELLRLFQRNVKHLAKILGYILTGCRCTGNFGKPVNLTVDHQTNRVERHFEFAGNLAGNVVLVAQHGAEQVLRFYLLVLATACQRRCRLKRLLSLDRKSVRIEMHDNVN